MATTLLDLIAVAFLAVFAYFVWAPLALLVVGLACLLASERATRRSRP